MLALSLKRTSVLMFEDLFRNVAEVGLARSEENVSLMLKVKKKTATMFTVEIRLEMSPGLI